jgi:hypothetical protein
VFGLWQGRSISTPILLNHVLQFPKSIQSAPNFIRYSIFVISMMDVPETHATGLHVALKSQINRVLADGDFKAP